MARASRASGIEKGRFIHDGPSYFPNSVVLYTRFETAALRQMFAYLREKEMLFQRDVKRHSGTMWGNEIQIRLGEIETQLIWMVANLR